MGISSDYYSILANIESGGNPSAVNSTTQATGLYQFTGTTAKALGYNLSDLLDPVTAQSAVEDLTNSNTSILSNAGVAVNNTTAYLAHLFGVGSAINIANADPSTPLASLVPAKDLANNPQYQGQTAGGAQNYISNLFGSDGSLGSQILGGVQSGLAASGLGGSSPITSTLGFINSIFNGQFATRAVFVVLGVVFVVVALIVLTGNSDKVITVAETAAKGAVAA